MANKKRIYLAEEVFTQKPRTLQKPHVPKAKQTVIYPTTMHPKGITLEVLVALLMATVVSSFPSGAPLSACGHLMPIHEDAAAQETASPFLILLSDTNYTTHQPIQGKPTIRSPSCNLILTRRLINLSKVNQLSVHHLAI